MNKTGLFSLIAIAGAALLIHEIAVYLKRRNQRKRLMKIVMAGQSGDAQAKRDVSRRPMTPAEHKIALHEQRG